MHVVEPAAVLAELVRCLEPGALVTVFEPDWSRFQVRSAVIDGSTMWLSAAPHPDVGRDRLSGQRRSGRRGRPDRGGRGPPVDTGAATREGAGQFRATMPKVLVVAETR